MAINNHHHEPEILQKSSKEVSEELLAGTSRPSSRFILFCLVLMGLTALGVVGFFMRLQDGFSHHTPWAYLAAAFAFILTTSMSAPLVAIAPRLAKAHFGRPVSRIAELWAVAGLLQLLILIPLILSLPDAEGRSTFWFTNLYREGWPPGTPHTWLVLSVVFLVLNGLALLWVAAIPDFAVGREKSSGLKGSIYRLLSLNWSGSKAEWTRLRNRVGILGAFYFMFLVTVHTFVSFDFAQSLVPGWRDSLFPTWHALSGIQGAVASTLVTAFVLRKFGGMKEYIGLNQFWSLGKLLLALSLLWAYFWWSGFIIFWYGKTETEQNLLELLMFGSYRPLFLATFGLCFLIPLLSLVWNPIRKSIIGPTVIATGVLIGTFLDRVRVYVASYSVGDVKGLYLEHVPAVLKPELADIFMMVGVLAGSTLLYTLATRLFPVINIWETKEGLLLQRVRPLNKVKLKVLAKPF